MRQMIKVKNIGDTELDSFIMTGSISQMIQGQRVCWEDRFRMIRTPDRGARAISQTTDCSLYISAETECEVERELGGLKFGRFFPEQTLCIETSPLTPDLYIRVVKRSIRPRNRRRSN